MGAGQRQQQEQGGQEGATGRGQGDRPGGAQRASQSVAKAERGQGAKRKVSGPCSKALRLHHPPQPGLDKLDRMCRRWTRRANAWSIPHVQWDLKKNQRNKSRWERLLRRALRISGAYELDWNRSGLSPAPGTPWPGARAPGSGPPPPAPAPGPAAAPSVKRPDRRGVRCSAPGSAATPPPRFPPEVV